MQRVAGVHERAGGGDVAWPDLGRTLLLSVDELAAVGRRAAGGQRDQPDPLLVQPSEEVGLPPVRTGVPTHREPDHDRPQLLEVEGRLGEDPLAQGERLRGAAGRRVHLTRRVRR